MAARLRVAVGHDLEVAAKVEQLRTKDGCPQDETVAVAWPEVGDQVGRAIGWTLEGKGALVDLGRAR